MFVEKLICSSAHKWCNYNFKYCLIINFCLSNYFDIWLGIGNSKLGIIHHKTQIFKILIMSNPVLISSSVSEPLIIKLFERPYNSLSSHCQIYKKNLYSRVIPKVLDIPKKIQKKSVSLYFCWWILRGRTIIQTHFYSFNHFWLVTIFGPLLCHVIFYCCKQKRFLQYKIQLDFGYWLVFSNEIIVSNSISFSMFTKFSKIHNWWLK